MRILITGGAGFVGSSLAQSFMQRDSSNEVVVVDNLRRRGSELNLVPLAERGIEFVHGDIRTRSDLDGISGEFDLLIEASAEPSVSAGLDGPPHYVIETNLGGTLNCLEFARHRAQLLVFLSTSRVYSIEPLQKLQLREGATRFELAEDQATAGVSARGIAEEFPTHLPRSLYGATKLASEIMIQEYVYAYNLKAIINRCGVIAGAGQFGRVEQGVFTHWVAGHYFQKPLRYTGYGGSGKQVRDLLHPADLFELVNRQLSDPASHDGQIFNVGGGEAGSTSLVELTDTCQRIVGKTVPVASEHETSTVDIPYYVTDASKVKKWFQWAPRRSVADIVREIAKWLQDDEAKLKPLFG